MRICGTDTPTAHEYVTTVVLHELGDERVGHGWLGVCWDGWLIEQACALAVSQRYMPFSEVKLVFAFTLLIAVLVSALVMSGKLPLKRPLTFGRLFRMLFLLFAC